MAEHPSRMTSGDEFLDALLTQAEQTNTLLGRILDRLPEPITLVDGEPGRINIREPFPVGTGREFADQPTPPKRAARTSRRGT